MSALYTCCRTTGWWKPAKKCDVGLVESNIPEQKRKYQKIRKEHLSTKYLMVHDDIEEKL